MKKTIAYILISLMTVYQVLGQSRKMEEKFFPEPNIDIPTPAFQKAEWKGFTKYKEMVAYVTNLSKEVDYIVVDQIGESQKGKEIIRIRINKPSA